MALWTALIAMAVSFGEMLSKYERKVIGDIFNRYLLIYLGINGLFALGAYYLLPSVADVVLKPEQAELVRDNSGWRVFVSAFGYLVLVRAKVFTVKDTPIGIDTLYTTFANYCLRHTNTMIRNRQNADLDEVYHQFPDLERYQLTLDDRINDAPENEIETIRAASEAILNSQKLAAHVKCKRIGELLLRIVGTRKELEKALGSVPSNALTKAAPPPVTL